METASCKERKNSHVFKCFAARAMDDKPCVVCDNLGTGRRVARYCCRRKPVSFRMISASRHPAGDGWVRNRAVMRAALMIIFTAM
jgi:DNA-directed RNA polymerase subunit N (RpoN/RPB10)